MSKNFKVEETTITEIHDAMLAGNVTSKELVNQYLERINTYDVKIVYINPKAGEEAEALDKLFKETKILSAHYTGFPC